MGLGLVACCLLQIRCLLLVWLCVMVLIVGVFVVLVCFGIWLKQLASRVVSWLWCLIFVVAVRAVVSLVMGGVSKGILRQLWSFCWRDLRLGWRVASVLWVIVWVGL